MGEQTSAETAPQRRFRWFSLVWVPILSAIVGAALTIFYTEWSNRLRYLQYYTASASGIISKPDLRGKQLQVSIDGKPIDNISTVALNLFNTTDQDFEDVPIEIVFAPVDGRQLSPIHGNIKTPKEFYDETPIADAGDGMLRFGYKFHVVNRDTQAFFESNYFFEGDKAPTVSVNVMKKGLVARQAEIPKDNSPWSFYIGPTFVLVIVIVIFELIWFLGGRKQQKKANGMFSEAEAQIFAKK